MKKKKLEAGQIWQVPKMLKIRIIFDLDNDGGFVEIAEPFYFDMVMGSWCNYGYEIPIRTMKAWITRTNAKLLPQRMRIGHKTAIPKARAVK